MSIFRGRHYSFGHLLSGPCCGGLEPRPFDSLLAIVLRSGPCESSGSWMLLVRRVSCACMGSAMLGCSRGCCGAQLPVGEGVPAGVWCRAAPNSSRAPSLLLASAVMELQS